MPPASWKSLRRSWSKQSQLEAQCRASQSGRCAGEGIRGRHREGPARETIGPASRRPNRSQRPASAPRPPVERLRLRGGPLRQLSAPPRPPDALPLLPAALPRAPLEHLLPIGVAFPHRCGRARMPCASFHAAADSARPPLVRLRRNDALTRPSRGPFLMLMLLRAARLIGYG